MRIRREFMLKYKHFLLVLGFLPLLALFNHLESSLIPVITMHTRVDEVIPFIPLFCIPYLLWFPYMGWAVIYSGIKDLPSFYQLIVGLFSGMGIAYLIFYFLPNSQDLRPLTYGKDFLSQLVFYIQSVDSNTNVFPSIHVINAIVVHDAIRSIPNAVTSDRIKQGSLFLMILICISTMFIKQHSIVDVIAGIVIAKGIYYIYQYISNIRVKKWKTIR